MITAGIGLHHAGVDSEPFALDKTRVHTRPNLALEYLPEDVALAEAAMPIDRECRVIGNPVVEVEPTEPAIGKMQLDFLAELALRADTVAVGDDQHPDHQLGINGGSAHLAVEGFKLVTKMGQYLRYGRIDPAQKMAIRNSTFQVQKIEQLALIDCLPPHHDPPPPLPNQAGANHGSPALTSTFSTASVNRVGDGKSG